MPIELKFDGEPHVPEASEFSDVGKATIDSLGLLDPESVPAFDKILDLLQMSTGMPVCLFSVFDGDRVFYKSKIGVATTSSAINLAFSPSGALEDPEDRIRFVEDLSKYPEVEVDKSLLGDTPIIFYAGLGVRAPNGLPVGNICVLDSVKRQCTGEIQRALSTARDLLEDSLKVRTNSVIDHLTGAYNRRHFDDMVRREWARAYRHTVPLTVIMIDIDHFKLFNDDYGHQAGDEALHAVGNALMGIVQRAGDIVARYGGEEFVMLLPQTSIEAAEVIAERSLEAVRALGLEHRNSEPGIVTISIGAATAGTKTTLSCGAAALIKIADQQLYVSKQNGRNQVTLALWSGESQALAD